MVTLRLDTVTNLILWNQYFQIKKENEDLTLIPDFDIKAPVFLLLILFTVGLENWIHIFVRGFFRVFRHEQSVLSTSRVFHALNSTFDGGRGQSPQDNLKILFEFVGVNPTIYHPLIHRVRKLMNLRNQLVHGHDVAEEMIVSGDSGHMDVVQSHLAQKLTWENLNKVEKEIIDVIDEILSSLEEAPSIPDNWKRHFSKERQEVSKYFEVAPDSPVGA